MAIAQVDDTQANYGCQKLDVAFLRIIKSQAGKLDLDVLAANNEFGRSIECVTAQ
ncbi:hypothetical protein [Undibacterium sp. Ji49W]|uniref:hypothetical protein n=1 Tax=Undibacterium sp. Ji49W TaxID=3413040 RepID=UPI003BF08849